MNAELLARARAWAAQDPDPVTAAALDELIQRAASDDVEAAAELADAFDGGLTFGTAGLRGALGPGPNRMNRVVVIRAAAGLAQYLRDTVDSGGERPIVVVGHDARYNSDVFARDTVELMAGAGFDAVLFDGPVPTPVVAFAIRALGAVAGVVVTASHNPPADNGYKVYLGDGSQIIPPADADIAARIDAVGDIMDLPRSDEWRTADPAVLDAYRERVAGVAPADGDTELRWVYTPLHGVGLATVVDVVARAGYPPAAVVAEQADPDPAFPTVTFPNPEEPGALDLSFALAKAEQAELVIANDPDADRCAVAIPTADGWRRLTGDELGVLLAADLLDAGVSGEYAASVVSSTMLARMCADHGESFTTTLTGFKWIGRVPGLVFGYEEALGYCCDPSAVADKDGISALVRILSIATRLKADGSDISTRLDELTRRHGLHLTDQLSVRVEDLSIITDAMARVRTRPPASLAGEAVAHTDLLNDDTGLPPTDAMAFAGESVRVVVRPSGTEPKLKCYLEVRLSPADSADTQAARAVAVDRMAALRRDAAVALGLA